ncbi:uncharacterized protein LOC108627131 isoform X2 [Ceratina calcarata]|uniref:Uncharacterized protein LOC108627131 isoform X2 n=1 Tax=Ceratina calcarata TaxID=156304 RepID=A0AAJ7WD63_9HYME|nr:uncharacterized protein LOC108627131 isoform X2 [Ceratina calcarata]
MVVGEASIHNIMGGMESTGGVRLHNHKRKLKQRFDIIKKLGQGTYGKVQLGINKETGQEVAIKTIKKCKIETEADLIRIRREIQIMSSVQHPNIIHIYEVFENREKMVLVMEYAAGGELYDYLSERKVLTEHEARRIFRQIATAVFYCHKHKICHRDLKLENILLDQVGNAKIADFGLSNVFDEQRLLNTFCGSPLYASPEIVRGTPYHGPEVDCWSLGVLLYTLVYGAMPFDGSNFKRLVKQISQSDYFEPKRSSPASPLIKDMLTVCPGKRADIERICTHWWVNEGYEQNCLDIAEDLAAQTPVRLDLLLSLVPQSASAEKLVVGDQQPAGDVANNVSSDVLVPTRCHSVGSLMELDQSSSDRRIRRELLEEEPRTAPITGDAKRKLETTPSMDETAAAGAKRKERSRRKEKRDEPEPRMYKSASRHHSAPIPNSITEEAMEVDPTVHVVPTCNIVESNKPEATAACLELIKECNERSPSKERSKTPVIVSQEQPLVDANQQTRRFESEASEEPGERAETVLERSQTISASSTDPSNAASSIEKDKRHAKESSVLEDNRDDLEATQREFKKLKEKALSLDSELSSSNDTTRELPAKTYERRRSKIFETAEKFNQLASNVAENEKPKKIFIPGVNVGGAKRVFERKASLSSLTSPPPTKPSASKMIIDVPPTPDAKKNEKSGDKSKSAREEEEEAVAVAKKKEEEEARKQAVDVITGALGKPRIQRRINIPPVSPPSSHEPKKLPLKIPVGENDTRSATVSVSTPVETKFFDEKPPVAVAIETRDNNDDDEDKPTVSSKMEITLKSATLPRSRKTSRAEISLSSPKLARAEDPAVAFKSEVEARIDAFQPQKLRTQRSEIAFPVQAAIPRPDRSSSLEPDTKPRNAAAPKERIIPIQVEAEHRQQCRRSVTPPPVRPPPMPQRSISQRSGSLSRQSTADSDTDSALGSTVGPEPIRKSPREYIIPIAVEGGGYVTPRSGSVEPESKTATPNSANVPRSSRFGRPRRMSSLLSDASEDESPFSSLHRDSEDLLQRHMHRLRSSRPSRQPSEHADSLSSGEDDDDDGFELLTAENLFSTLLSRVRSLTQRLNVDDNRTAGFPSSRLFGRLGSNSSQAFWGLNKPLSRRLSESQFRHSLSRDGDTFGKKDSANSSNPGTPNSPGSQAGNHSRESVFDIGSNTLPRGKIAREDAEADPLRIGREMRESFEQSFTPSLARRLSKTLIEQTRRSLTRSPSVSREKDSVPSFFVDSATSEAAADRSISTVSDQTEYKDRTPTSRILGRSNSLLEPTIHRASGSRVSPRRSVSLFDNDDHHDHEDDHDIDGRVNEDSDHSSSREVGRWYKDAGCGRSKLRKDSFRSYRADKIQEETMYDGKSDNTCSLFECAPASVTDSNAKSYETSPTESSSSSCNVVGEYKSPYKTDSSRNFENRLLAAENLIKESKLKNLGPTASSVGNRNLSSSYQDTDKCDKRSLLSIAEASGISVAVPKRRSCIPSLGLRSGSLTREPSVVVDRRKSFADSRDASLITRNSGPEKSLLGRIFKTASGNRESDSKDKDKEKEKEKDTEKPQKCKQRRISRFLRPDFFDTPREESQYAKEKDERKAAENERRKSRFIRRKSENKAAANPNREGSVEQEKKREKELKNEINSLRRDRRSRDESCEERANAQRESPEGGSKDGFLHSLEKKLERLRSNEDNAQRKKRVAKSTANGRWKSETARERSAPPIDCSTMSEHTVSAKRASSVEELCPPKNSKNGKAVSSVLGLFKTDSKQLANGSRSQSTILSRLKKSPPKTSKPAKPGDEEATTPVTGSSRIPTKLDTKSTKRIGGNGDAKRSDAKTESSPKRSPPKDGPILPKEKRASREREPDSGKPISDRDIEERNGNDREEKEGASKAVKKSVDKSRKKVTSRTSLDNGSSTEPSKLEDDEAEKKAKKSVKKISAESSECNDSRDGVKKKKVVRAVRKITKKSVDSAAVINDRANATAEEKDAKVKVVKKKVTGSNDEETNGISKSKENGFDETEAAATTVEENRSTGVVEESQRGNRSNLKLDLSKIPQHSFRNKKDSPKSDSPKNPGKDVVASIDEDVPDKLTECLSKVTHHASITGNKIIIDKPLRARDVAELKKEVAECARIIEECAPQPQPRLEPGTEETLRQSNQTTKSTDDEQLTDSKSDSIVAPKLPSVQYPNELLSPDEPESFDSWSVSSTELRTDLHSPTHSLYAGIRNDDGNSESVIDRIRRRSFYTRFNDRRRPSLTAPPPGVGLPRKSSFTGHWDRASGKYGTTTNRNYGTYDRAGAVGRNRSLDRTVYTSIDLKSPNERLSSSYDPLGRYLRSPTFDLSPSRSRRYHSVDFSGDPDPSYRCSFASSLNDTFGYSSLPRRYGTEPRTIEYYEELLAPSTGDYLPARRSPISAEYSNGYRRDGSFESASNRKSTTENPSAVILETTPIVSCDERPVDHRRSTEATETKHSPTTDVTTG